MKLRAKWGSDSRLLSAWMIPAAGLFFGQFVLNTPTLIAIAIMMLVLLCFGRLGGTAASSLSLDSQELVAHFSFRKPLRIPLERIAAIEIYRRSWLTRGEPLAFITIFAKDDPTVIELCAESWEVNPFLLVVAENAKRVGLKDVAPFTLPRSLYLHHLALVAVALFVSLIFSLVARGPFAWTAVASVSTAFVLHSLLVWSRYAALANDISAREPKTELDEWKKLIRAS